MSPGLIALLFAAALPAYLRSLPWACEEGGPSDANGARLELLAQCKPNGRKPELQGWVQRVADAMGYAGLNPRLRFGPLGPHLTGFARDKLVSATFVKQGDRFDVWIAVHGTGMPLALPELPEGATRITDHYTQTGQRLVSFRLEAPVREAVGLMDATLGAIGAQPLGRQDEDGGGKSGRLLWQGQTGMYALQVDESGSVLSVYVGGAR